MVKLSSVVIITDSKLYLHNSVLYIRPHDGHQCMHTPGSLVQNTDNCTQLIKETAVLPNHVWPQISLPFMLHVATGFSQTTDTDCT